MSVLAATNVYISPLFREPGLPQHNPGIIGRYHAAHVITGDASGGGYQNSFQFDNVQGLFGNHALFDVRWMHAQCQAGGTIVPFGAWFYIDAYEYSNDTALTFRAIMALTALGTSMTNAQLPDFKFGFSKAPSVRSAIVLEISPNTNGVGILFSVGGYIYDERMI